MSTTPEGKIKRDVEKMIAIFKARGAPIRFFKPVQTGYGARDLDYVMTVNGYALRVETKAPGEWLTGPQRLIVKEELEANGAVFIVSGDEGLQSLGRWIDRACTRANIMNLQR